MKHYFICRTNFYNCYYLCYTTDNTAPSNKWEKITRKEAIAYARAERRRRKTDSFTSGYADAYIFPYYHTEEDVIKFYNNPDKYSNDGIIVEF